MNELPLCACGEFYQSHHTECPARRAFESVQAEVARLKLRNIATALDEEDAREEQARDALRYRWLKANHLQLGPDCWIRTGDDLDETIDAALDEAGKQPGIENELKGDTSQ